MSTEQPQATKGYEQFVLRQAGDAIPFAGNAAPVLDEGGRLLGWVQVLRDVTFEREVDRLKSSLVSTVSHELRTPLTMIQGFSELVLTRNLSSEKSDEALRHINTSAQRLARLIDDLLTVSRIESARTEVRAVALDLRATLDDVVAEFKDRRHVDVDMDPELGRVLADPDMVVQILTNLISNAVKYSPAGSPLSVHVRRMADGADISVTDQGIGMSEAEQARLFERFFRADREAVKAVGGTGLGLYFTKHLVTLQGGQMRVKTKLGEGSTFAFTLPLAPAQPKERAS
jgi:signal transduction histidine kinase